MSHHFFNTQGNFTCVAFGAMRETAGRQSEGLAQERARYKVCARASFSTASRLENMKASRLLSHFYFVDSSEGGVQV